MASFQDVGSGMGQPAVPGLQRASDAHNAQRQTAEPRQAARQRAEQLDADSGHGARGHSPVALARLIEGEIIPRLLMAHRSIDALALPGGVIAGVIASAGDGYRGGRQVSMREFEAFVPLVLRHEVHALLVEIDALLARGVALDTLYLDLLAPAARRLGEYWEDDVCDFVDVTMGLWRLQQLVHELGSRHAPADSAVRVDRRAFFAAAPGDQHSFGVVMIEDFFRRAGWQTASASSIGRAALLAMAREQWFELIGLTVSCETHIETLPETIAALRKNSQNPTLLVMVGGRIFTEQPGLAARIGADGTAPDGKQAVRCAETLLDRIAYPPAAAQPQRG